MDRACCDLDILKKNGYDNIYIYGNISTSQLEDKRFIDVLRRAIERYQFAPEDIELEITVRLALEINRKIKGLLDAINGLGSKLSMDDFYMGGTAL